MIYLTTTTNVAIINNITEYLNTRENNNNDDMASRLLSASLLGNCFFLRISFLRH